jgi:hypothetical protein
MTSPTIDGDRAVVLDPSTAGLLSAGVLVDAYARSTVVERDNLPLDVAHPADVPQGLHLHGLHPRGRLIDLIESMSSTRPSSSPASVAIDVRTRGLSRTLILLCAGAAPILAIPAHVFGIVPIHLTALWLIVPIVFLSIALLVWRPRPHDRVTMGGFLAGLIAVAAYDAFRLPTVYSLHWWGDFIPQLGGWITDDTSNALVGYAWRYAGDGGGIGLVFFASVASFGVTSWSRQRVMAVAIAFAVVPVWAGLIATVALAPHGETLLFPLTGTTLTLSLIGHIIFGTVLGACCVAAAPTSPSISKVSAS